MVLTADGEVQTNEEAQVFVHDQPRLTKEAKRKMSYFLLSLDCRAILVPGRPPHRHRRTRQVHLQVQHQSEVTIGHQETGAIQKKEGQR